MRMISWIVLILTILLGYPAQAQRATGLVKADPVKYASIPQELPPLAGVLPSSRDLSDLFPEVGDQGRQASCVGWALAYFKAATENQKRHWGLSSNDHWFSPAYIYNQAKLAGDCKQGTPFDAAFQLLVTIGDALWPAFPYLPNSCTALPSDEIKKAATVYRTGEVHTIRLDDEFWVKSQIASDKPVIVGFSFDTDFENWKGNKVYSRVASSSIEGYHAMVVVAYDDNYGEKGSFKLINSWGLQFGDRGFVWVSYDTFRRNVDQAYVIDDLPLAIASAAAGAPGGAASAPTPTVSAPDTAQNDLARNSVASTPVQGNTVALPVTPVVPASVFTFGGTREFDGNVTVSARQIVFAPGSVVRVRNGSTLELRAESIVVEGTATIDGTGEPGVPGSPGPDNAELPLDLLPDSNYKSIRNRVASSENDPLRGHKGADGGSGGPGATIVLSRHALGGALIIKVKGGPGGPPGPGGSGRLIRNQRQFYCDGCMYSRNGPDGHKGPDGPNGRVIYGDMATRSSSHPD